MKSKAKPERKKRAAVQRVVRAQLTKEDWRHIYDTIAMVFARRATRCGDCGQSAKVKEPGKPDYCLVCYLQADRKRLRKALRLYVNCCAGPADALNAAQDALRPNEKLTHA